MRMMNASCDCVPPCERSYFSSRFSATYLSELNIERIVLTDERKKKQVKSELERASETLQRSKQEIKERDQEHMTTILKTNAVIGKNVEALFMSLNTSLYSDVHGIMNIIEEGPTYLAEDYSYFSSLVKQLDDYHLKDTIDLLLVEVKSFLTRSKAFHRSIKRCLNDIQFDGKGDIVFSNVECFGLTSWNSSLCNETYNDVKIQTKLVLNYYTAMVSLLSEDGMKTVPEHDNCTAILNWINSTGNLNLDEFYNLIMGLGHTTETLISSPNVETVETVESLLMLLNGTSQQIDRFVQSEEMIELENLFVKQKNIALCEWMDADINELTSLNYDYYENGFVNVVNSGRDLHEIFGDAVTTMHRLYTRRFETDVFAIQQYLEGNMTKLNLSLIITKGEMSHFDWPDKLEVVAEAYENFFNYFDYEKKNMIEMYEKYITTSIPLLTYNSLNRTVVGNAIMNLRKNNFIESELMYNTSGVLLHLLKSHYENITDFYAQEIEIIENGELAILLSGEREHLQRYTNTIVMNNNFYL